ncbi:hypothetical protein E2C01_079789 [Portunus trituberculatus]|uniref:Uncharacterized protein n=1 Tax=Portunus trituberculatus TaxID=210409 RepID=A0A5B7IHT1_PORTR|nr:hypothetical protein [Portunus trituberculatus]
MDIEGKYVTGGVWRHSEGKCGLVCWWTVCACVALQSWWVRGGGSAEVDGLAGGWVEVRCFFLPMVSPIPWVWIGDY